MVSVGNRASASNMHRSVHSQTSHTVAADHHLLLPATSFHSPVVHLGLPMPECTAASFGGSCKQDTHCLFSTEPAAHLCHNTLHVTLRHTEVTKTHDLVLNIYQQRCRPTPHQYLREAKDSVPCSQLPACSHPTAAIQPS